MHDVVGGQARVHGTGRLTECVDLELAAEHSLVERERLARLAVEVEVWVAENRHVTKSSRERRQINAPWGERVKTLVIGTGGR